MKRPELPSWAKWVFDAGWCVHIDPDKAYPTFIRKYNLKLTKAGVEAARRLATQEVLLRVEKARSRWNRLFGDREMLRVRILCSPSWRLDRLSNGAPSYDACDTGFLLKVHREGFQ